MMMGFIQWLRSNWEKVGFLLSIYLMGIMILSLGPSFQQHVTALIVSYESSLYSSVYKDAVVNLPGLKDWLFAQSYGEFLIGSALLMLALLYSQTVRGAFILLTIVGFGFWMSLDTYNIVKHETGGFSYFFECLVSNIFGSCIYAAIYIVVLSITQKLKGATLEHPLLVSSVSMAVPVILGVFIVLLQYYIMTLLFHAAPSNIEIKLGETSKFTYLIDEEIKKSLDEQHRGCCDKAVAESKEDKYFSVFNGRFAGQLDFNGLGDKPMIKLNGSPETTYDVSVAAYVGCVSKEISELKIDEEKSKKLLGVRELSVEIDGGMLQLFSESVSGNFETERMDAGQVWLKKQDNLFEITSFIDSSKKADYWVDNRSLIVSMRVPLVGDDSGSMIANDRRVEFKSDKKGLGLNFLALKNKRVPEECTLLDLSANDEVYDSTTGAILVNIVMKITKPDTGVLISRNKMDYLTFSGLNGWYAIKKISADDFKEVVEEGVMQGLSFGGVESFQINGEQVSNTEGRWYSAYKTNVVGSVDDNGSLRISGTAENVWSDHKRLNKTRWESLDSATQAILLGLIGSMLAAFATIFWRCWTANETYYL